MMKSIPLHLLLVFAVACGSKTEKKITLIGNTSPVRAGGTVDTGKELEDIKRLLHAENPNLALAQLLARALPPGQAQEMATLVQGMEPQKTRDLIQKFTEDSLKQRWLYLYHEQNYGTDRRMLSQLLTSADELGSRPLSPVEKMAFSFVGYQKEKALNQIIRVYDSKATQLAKEMAQDIVFEMAQDPRSMDLDATIATGERIRAIQAIKASLPYMKMLDQYFKNSNLSQDEQYTVVLSGIVAGAVFDFVKDQHGFQHVLQEGRRIVHDAVELGRKAKEFCLLVGVLQKHARDTENNWRDLSNGMQGSYSALRSAWGDARGRLSDPDVETRNIMSFLYRSVLGGDQRQTPNTSILTQSVTFDQNFQLAVGAAGKLSTNLGAILETTERMAQILGVKPSKDIERALETVKTVNNVITTVQGAMTGFSQGGYYGAFAALASSPMLGMMSGGDPAASKLDAINKKLDVVLRMQRQMLDMQLSTMDMIKNLAMMVDKFHEQEMLALSELRDLSIVDLELNKVNLNDHIRACERLISYQLNLGREYTPSARNLDSIRSMFYGKIKSNADLKRVVISSSPSDFSTCQLGIAEAFSATTSTETPIRAIFSTDENSNLSKFNREKFLPLWSILGLTSGGLTIDTMPLHLPAKTIEGLAFKRPYYDGGDGMTQDELEGAIYSLDELISVQALERYTLSLMVLQPFLELNAKSWFRDSKGAVDDFLASLQPGILGQGRSTYFLRNALRLIQSAIAQEAILAGEPLIQRFAHQDSENIFSTTACDQAKFSGVLAAAGSPALCSVRGNKLLMKNLITYMTWTYGPSRTSGEYGQAIAQGNLDWISQNNGLGLPASSYEVVNQAEVKAVVVKLPLEGEKVQKISLPTAEEVSKGELIYSENMSKLLLLQDQVIDSLRQVSPFPTDYSQNDFLGFVYYGIGA